MVKRLDINQTNVRKLGQSLVLVGVVVFLTWALVGCGGSGGGGSNQQGTTVINQPQHQEEPAK